MTCDDVYLWRVTRRLSQKEAASLLGVSQRAVSYWETRSPPRDVDSRVRAAEALIERFGLIRAIETGPLPLDPHGP
jgi:transcriptional regulator with XRE-family HTH domain